MADLEHIKGDLFKLFFVNSQDAQYIADWETGKYILVNPIFTQLFGYSQEDIEKKGLTLSQLVEERSVDIEPYRKRLAQREKYKPERYKMQFRSPEGEIQDLEFVVEVVEYEGHELLVGSARDVTSQTQMAAKLTAKTVRLQRAGIETGKAIVRISQLTEKIKNIPILIGSLLQYDDPDELLQGLADLLCSPYGMNYRDANFYMVQEEELVLKYSTSEPELQKLDLNAAHYLAGVARGEEVEMLWSEGIMAVPMKSRKNIEGVIEIFLDTKEKVIFDQDNKHRASQLGIVRTLGNVTGLLLSNIRLYNRVHQQSLSDPLTTLYNRRYFENKLKDEMERSLRYNRDLSLIFIDVDGLKAVNDRLGHAQGDSMLREVAEIMREQFRASDIVSRLGGDEFTVILPETGLDNSSAVAEKLRKRVEEYEFTLLDPSEEPMHVTLSIGVAGASALNDDWEKILLCADNAVYQSKHGGRNKVTVIETSVHPLSK